MVSEHLTRDVHTAMFIKKIGLLTICLTKNPLTLKNLKPEDYQYLPNSYIINNYLSLEAFPVAIKHKARYMRLKASLVYFHTRLTYGVEGVEGVDGVGN